MTCHHAAAEYQDAYGVRGVTWSKRANAWQARANLNGRYYWGGYHSTLEAAARAARALRKELHTHDDHDEWLKKQEKAS